MTREQAFAFIKAHKYAVLSTVNAYGSPESALVGIAVTPELEIIFDTVKSSRKYENLKRNPAAAIVVGWTSEKTLQYEGFAREPRGEELRHYQSVYFAMWTDGLIRLDWPGICHLVVKPKWVRFSDYEETPPIIEELRF